MRARKYDYLLILQGDYGHGWEDLCAEDQHNPDGSSRAVQARREIKARRREYLENEGGRYRIITRRELRTTT